ncbi:tyrosinase precursor [Mariannaea sp. PMI_226]|nr:tyrosinase precursor [Mariannaea sp. PMI_226]
MRYRLPLAGSLLASCLLVVGQGNYDYGADIESLTRRRDGNDSSLIVTGRLPLTLNGTLPVRPEIREMKEHTYRWDLFILALSMFQSVSQDDPTSWYQIAGIHGVPFQPWNGVEAVPQANQSGYCPHSSVLFPTWHRPYLALFEARTPNQEMHRIVNVIAGMFPNETERRSYQQAASDFRIPYWDWSIHAPEGDEHLPKVFWDSVITQNGPKGVQQIRNPLYAYQFHPKDEEAFIWAPLNSWDETKRAPDLSVNETAPPSNNDQVNEALLSKLSEVQQRLFILFSNYKDFNTFGNKAWAASQNLSGWDSIESIHDIIHIYGGMKGHMTYVPLSSFDPLFLLHHTMTDRLVSIWQLLNPTSWMTSAPAGETSYTTLKGEMQNSKTALTPFYASNDGTFWDSDMARTTEAFGYTYADVDISYRSEEDVRNELIKKINGWYGTSSLSGIYTKQRRSNRRSAAKRLELSRVRFDGQRPNVKFDAADPESSAVVSNQRYTEWIANVAVNVEALDGNFGVHFFLGDPPFQTKDWNGASNLIGTVAIFTMNRQTGSENKISGTSPLTSAMLKMVAAGEINSLVVEVAEPFLREVLQFRVLGSDGEEVEPNNVAGLYVGITSSEVKLPMGNTELPQWGSLVERIQMWPSS